MRLITACAALAAIQLLAAAASPAQAGYYDGPWCARFWGGDTEYENCSMRGFEMCLAEIRGTGGNTLCAPNPHYRARRSESAPARNPRSAPHT